MDIKRVSDEPASINVTEDTHELKKEVDQSKLIRIHAVAVGGSRIN